MDIPRRSHKVGMGGGGQFPQKKEEVLSQEGWKEKSGKHNSAFSLKEQWGDITKTAHIHERRHFSFL